MDEIYNVPVPRRFLPLINRTLADAYASESTTEASSLESPSLPLERAVESTKWTEEEVALAYRESSPTLRVVLDYLADHPKRPVTSLELAQAAYPNDSAIDAESKLYGVLGYLGRRSYKYGKSEWFFTADRERKPDGSPGSMVYIMTEEKAAWLRKASGRQDSE